MLRTRCRLCTRRRTKKGRRSADEACKRTPIALWYPRTARSAYPETQVPHLSTDNSLSSRQSNSQMSHIVLRRLLKLNWRVSEQVYVITLSRRIGKAYRSERNVLSDLTSQMRRIEPLKKLRCKPHGSEVFHCDSIGINADCIDP
jgi:hypothetical protein